MKTLIASFASAWLCCSSAWATDPPPRYGATKAKAAPAEARQDASKPADKARARSRRRAVRQQFDELPMRTPPTAVYAPQLTPRIDPTPVPPPVTINCVGAACADANGGSYRGGVGTTLISPQGKVCSNNGITVQCF